MTPTMKERLETAAEAGQAAVARMYLADATEHLAPYRGSTQDRDSARRVLAEAGTGHAVLALIDALAGDPAGELLAREAGAVRDEIGRADAKCGVLSALTGAAAVFAVSQAAHGPAIAQGALAVSGLVLAAATTLALWALRPRLGSAGWCRWSLLTATEIRAAAEAGNVDQAAVVGDLSRIARLKYARVRLAVDLAMAGLAVLAIGMVAGVFA